VLRIRCEASVIASFRDCLRVTVLLSNRPEFTLEKMSFFFALLVDACYLQIAKNCILQNGATGSYRGRLLQIEASQKWNKKYKKSEIIGKKLFS